MNSNSFAFWFYLFKEKLADDRNLFQFNWNYGQGLNTGRFGSQLGGRYESQRSQKTIR